MSAPRITLGDGFEVSRQGYGAMSLTDVYGEVSDEQALATLEHALDLGITFIDTANIYGDGRSESTIAKVLKTRRDEIQLATKFGFVRGGAPGQRAIRGDRAHIREQIDLSLARLGTDHVDIYYQHRVDPQVPIEETVGAIAELITEGKVRHIGLSEPTGDEIRRAAAVHPIAAVQSEWSIFSRDVEVNVLPAIREIDSGFVPYSPLARGLLTGAYRTLDTADSSIRSVIPRFSEVNLAHNIALVDVVADVATQVSARTGQAVTVAQVALAWLEAKARGIGVPIASIPGSRFAARVDENLAALGVELAPAEVQRLDGLAGGVAGLRSADTAATSGGREGLLPVF
ncbi:aldo/keto reductase [Corynebacterium pacaense]|uniref:aldo/keto reductase n=1 Tax=Corynebacterium pacaense TaxID=1816684 RepID=UPI0009B9D35A|nr:aldo/keto reductase [Corynebacterium pacaense]